MLIKRNSADIMILSPSQLVQANYNNVNGINGTYRGLQVALPYRLLDNEYTAILKVLISKVFFT